MRIETKFSYGDKVFMLADNMIVEGTIIHVSAETIQGVVTPTFNGTPSLPPYRISVKYVVKYNNSQSECRRGDDQLFATKQELINSL